MILLKYCKKWRLAPTTSAPELTEVNLNFTSIQKYLFRVSWALVGVESHLVTSNLNLWLVVIDVMSYFLIWSQRFRLVINCILWTTTFKKRTSQKRVTRWQYSLHNACQLLLYLSVTLFPSHLLHSFNYMYESLKQTTGVWSTTNNIQRRCWYALTPFYTQTARSSHSATSSVA